MEFNHVDKNSEEKKSKELEEELIELEFDEDSVAYYIEDEEGNEVGVCLLEDGKQVEYYYEENADSEYVQVPQASSEGSAKSDTATDATSDESNDKTADPSALQQYGKDMSESLKETKDELMDAKEDMGVVARELAKTAVDIKDSYQQLIDGLNPVKSIKNSVKEAEIEKKSGE